MGENGSTIAAISGERVSGRIKSSDFAVISHINANIESSGEIPGIVLRNLVRLKVRNRIFYSPPVEQPPETSVREISTRDESAPARALTGKAPMELP